MRSSNLALTTNRLRTKVYAPWSVFSALQLIAEEQSTGVISRVLADFGIGAHSVSIAADADGIARTNRIDLLVCDLEMPGAGQLACLQPSTAWRGMAIGLMPVRRMEHMLKRRIHFRLPKPFSVDMLVRSLRASYTNMAQRRISTYRHSVPARIVSGTLSHRGGQRTLHHLNVLNVSQTGLCLHAGEPLPQGASIAMSLVLPEISYSMHASGNVIWSHSTGRAGVAFDHAGCPEMKRFQQHLNHWLPRELGVIASLS